MSTIASSTTADHLKNNNKQTVHASHSSGNNTGVAVEVLLSSMNHSVNSTDLGVVHVPTNTINTNSINTSHLQTQSPIKAVIASKGGIRHSLGRILPSATSSIANTTVVVSSNPSPPPPVTSAFANTNVTTGSPSKTTTVTSNTSKNYPVLLHPPVTNLPWITDPTKQSQHGITNKSKTLKKTVSHKSMPSFAAFHLHDAKATSHDVENTCSNQTSMSHLTQQLPEFSVLFKDTEDPSKNSRRGHGNTVLANGISYPVDTSVILPSQQQQHQQRLTTNFPSSVSPIAETVSQHVKSKNTTIAYPLHPLSSQQTFTSATSSTSTTTNTPEIEQVKSTTSDGTAIVYQRRQKRLERNRVSARESRRRRKQYLEVLEDRVTYFSEEMDRGRRDHVFSAISTYDAMRKESIDHALSLLQHSNTSNISTSNRANDTGTNSIHSTLLENFVHLSRTSKELRLANLLCKEYLMSLVVPPTIKFILWLTLQNEVFFRGGRAPSERLSAARIGERLLHFDNNDKVGPDHGMWPLFCHEVGLSYDQEERVRSYQRQLLLSQLPQSTWMDRHLCSAADLVINTLHDSIIGLMEATKRREDELLNILSPEQMVRFLDWSSRKKNSLRMKKQVSERGPNAETVVVNTSNHEVAQSNHDAVNLYIVHYKLSSIAARYPKIEPILESSMLRKQLGRRPKFESLGNSGAYDDAASDNMMLSCSSSSSLKRCSSEMSCDDMDPMQHLETGSVKRSSSSQRFSLDETSIPSICIHISPEEAENGAATFLAPLLDPIRSIMPLRSKSFTTDYKEKAVPLAESGKSKSSNSLRSHKNVAKSISNNAFESKVMLKKKSYPAKSQQSYLPFNLESAYSSTCDPSLNLVDTTPYASLLQAKIPSTSVNQQELIESVEKFDFFSYQPDPVISFTGFPFVSDNISSMTKVDPNISIGDEFSSELNIPDIPTSHGECYTDDLRNHDPLQYIIQDNTLNNGLSGIDDDFLLQLSEEDWAIGEGLDMDIS